MRTVTVYDCTTFWEFGYWILGFRRLAEAGKIRLRMERGRKSPIGVEDAAWSSLLFSVEENGRSRLGYLDNRDGYSAVRETVLDRVDVYFKFNYCPAHLADALRERAERIAPTGFFFPCRIDPWPQVPLAAARFVRGVVLARRDLGRDTIEDLKKVPGIDATAIDDRKDRIVFSGQ